VTQAPATDRGGRPPTVLEIAGTALAYWRPHWRPALVLLALLVVPQAYKAFFAYSQRLIVDRGLLARDPSLLLAVVVALAAGFLLAGAASLVAAWLGARVSATILNRLRERMFARLQRLSIPYFHRVSTGDVVARFTSDLADVQKSLTTRMIDAVFALLGLAINVPVAFALEWRLALVMCAAIPVVGLGTRLFGARAAEARYRLKQEEAEVANAVQESVRAQPVVKVFRLADWSIARFRVLLDRLLQRATRAECLAELVASTSSLGVLGAQVLVLGFGAWLAIDGSLSAGTLVAFLALHAIVSKDAYDLTKKVIPALIASSGGLRRIDELLGAPVDVADAPDARPLGRIDGPLCLERVTFAYGDGRRALDDVSLSIQPGERVTLVGPSGSGKSTVIQLLLRFYDPAAGRVTVAGNDLRGVRLDSWHEQVAAVFQESFLFAGTIAENIALGRPGASREEVVAAARAAEIHDLVSSLPEGYETEVGEAGGRLSGGQRQRLAIARAILRDPAVLLLDEATSALDPATEAGVNATLERLSAGRIVVSVTHRLESARGADRIVVLDAGRVVETGTHDQLIAGGGLYRQLWEKQHGVAVSPDGREAAASPDLLAAVPLLAPLDREQRETLAAALRVVHAEAGSAVVREGEPGDAFYLVARGRLEVVAGVPPDDRRLAVLDQGDWFGELALLRDRIRSATVRALVPCVLLALDRARFDTLVDAYPGVRREVERLAARRAARAADPLATITLPAVRSPGRTG